MSVQDDVGGFGCPAFGHLASAFVDQELSRAEIDRYAIHLPGCLPCQRLCAQYRALDIAATPAYPRPTEADWDAAWAGVSRAIEGDREAERGSPAAAFLRRLGTIWQEVAWVRPLAATAAAVGLIGLSLALRQAWAPGKPEGVEVAGRPVPTAVTVAHAHAAEVLSVTCRPGWEPVVWTIGGDDPTTVVQCQPIEI